SSVSVCATAAHGFAGGVGVGVGGSLDPDDEDLPPPHATQANSRRMDHRARSRRMRGKVAVSVPTSSLAESALFTKSWRPVSPLTGRIRAPWIKPRERDASEHSGGPNQLRGGRRLAEDQ